jgi:hypothetical protein
LSFVCRFRIDSRLILAALAAVAVWLRCIVFRVLI